MRNTGTAPRALQDQERLLAAYEDANRAAARRVKALEAQAKQREEDMAEERRALEREVMRASQHAQARNADTAANFRCAALLPAPPPPYRLRRVADDAAAAAALPSARSQRSLSLFQCTLQRRIGLHPATMPRPARS